MKLEYRGVWDNAIPTLDGNEAPANPFVAAITFPNNERIEGIVRSVETEGSVSDHGHTYRSSQRRLVINTVVFGFITPIQLPVGTDIDIVSNVATTYFKRGDKVYYIPRHAHGDLSHRDVERGVVSSTNDDVVFVKYGVTSPDADITSKATDPLDLRHR